MAVNPIPDAAAPEPIRLSGTSYAVLSLLELSGTATPYDLKQALERSIENFWPVPHTTFYAEPERLARGGFLSVRQEPDGRRRKLYELTEQGRRALHDWAHSPDVAAPQLRDEGVLKVFAGGDPLPLMRRRADWHRAKLAELEGYLEAVSAAAPESGVRQSLLIGTGYHRVVAEALERYLASQAPAAHEPAAEAGAAQMGDAQAAESQAGERSAAGRPQAATGSS